VLIGLISDTHSLIRPQALEALAGSDLILHAGDVGGATVLGALERIAPVHAVLGNVDPPDGTLPEHIRLTLEGVSVHVSHGNELGSPTPSTLLERYDEDVLIYGHTHKALVHREAARVVVNPGAAGPARFNVKPSVALMRITGGSIEVEIVWLIPQTT
jgi:putative phosphoesterase